MRSYEVGDWTFDADSGELSRAGERRRLEPRAARTLQLLIEANGAIVPQDRIIAEVWGGRSLSENSISVVISQLRRVLDDNARQPLLIETVPKRGYRLVTESPTAAQGQDHRIGSHRTQAGLFVLLACVALLIAGVAWLGVGQGSVKPTIAVSDVVNQTGNPAYAVHARATTELIVDQLTKRGFNVRRVRQGADLEFASKLVMWNGQPSLGMTLTDNQGAVRWSAMTKGGPAGVPAGVQAELDKFETRLSEL